MRQLQYYVLTSSLFLASCATRRATHAEIETERAQIEDLNASNASGFGLFEQDDSYRKVMIEEGTKLIEKLRSGNIKLKGSTSVAEQLGIDGLCARTGLSQSANIQGLKNDLMVAANSIVWAISAVGGKDAESMAFNLQDSDRKIYEFMKFYTDYAEKEKTGGPYAYGRNPSEKKSSHLKNVTQSKQWGLDMRDSDGKLLKLLPGDKTHILWGDYVHNVKGRNVTGTYIKAETIGIGTLSDKLAHGLDFIDSWKAKTDLYRGEKLEAPSLVKKLKTALITQGISTSDLKKKPLFELVNDLTDYNKMLLSEEIGRIFENEDIDLNTRLGSEVQISDKTLRNYIDADPTLRNMTFLNQLTARTIESKRVSAAKAKKMGYAKGAAAVLTVAAAIAGGVYAWDAYEEAQKNKPISEGIP